MTSKLAIKQSKKDRPRSSEKIAASKSARRSKGGGTPDNKTISPLVDAGGPNGNALGFESPLQRQSEIDQQIMSLRINPKELKSYAAPLTSKGECKTTKVLVKKRAPVPTSPKQSKKITVARRAPSDADLKLPNPDDFPGLRLDNSGRIIPHSILGSIEDFVQQAAKAGDTINASLNNVCKSAPSPWPEDEENTKPWGSAPRSGQAKIDETRALENWERQMKKRRKEQQYLSDTMNVPPDMLLMNQDVDFRMKQEDRALIDRAIPAMDYGKGYRVGSEFWKQVENVGGGEGIDMTLTQTERGFAPSIEYIGKPVGIRRSLGTDWSETRRMAFVHYPWLKSEYLRERKHQLIGVIDELASHRPYMDELEVIGQSVDSGQEMNNNKQTEDETATVTDEISQNFDNLQDPLADYEDVVPLPIFGPSLTINGYSAQWRDLADRKEADEGLELRLQFHSEAGTKSSSHIDITNDGTAAIYFSWKKLPSKDPFGIKRVRPLQRFYFDIRNGVILPNDSLKIKFTFQSINAGIFSETWLLDTQPILCGGAPITIVLKGVATEEDKLAKQRKELEEELQRRQKASFIREIVEEIFNGVRTPPRPSTPIDTYITEEELFSRQNDKMTFNTEAVSDLKHFYQQLNPDDHWDMNMQTLLEVAKAQEDDETKESLIQKLNEDVQMFAFEADDPVQRPKHNFCYQILCEAVDNFYSKAGALRKSMGLPAKEFHLEVQQEEVTKKPKKGQSQDVQKQTPDKKLDSKKKDTRPASSRGKSSGNPKTRAKDGTSTSSSNQKQLSVETTANKSYGYKPSTERRAPATPQEVRYSESLYLQMYDILCSVANKMEEIE